MTDEELVRSVWDHVVVLKGGEAAIEWIDDSRAIRIRFQDFVTCAEFTRERLEQIRQVEEEIHCLDYYETFQRSAGAKEDADIVKRILAREQAALAELKKGMRP